MARDHIAPGEDESLTAMPRKRRRGKPSRNGKPVLTNYREEELPGENGENTTVRFGLPIGAIGSSLYTLTDGWPRQVDSQLFVEGTEGRALWLETTDALFAWIGRRLPEHGNNPIRWASGQDMVTKAEFFSGLQQTATRYDSVESFPHCPPLPNSYYLHPPPKGGNGAALGKLLARFHPASLVDADLIRAFFLSLVWGGRPGQRPAWLFTAEDDDQGGGRGVGKSKVVQMGALLVGGHIDASPSEPIKELVTRILSRDGMDKRVVLFDNVKTLRFSCAELEALITNDVVSGRRLYVGEGRRPNNLTYCLTLNGASLSRDMAQRCVIVKMGRPSHAARWETETVNFIEANRWAIIGDIIAALKAPAAPFSRHSRWWAWEDEVLARVGDPAECLKVITERQGEVDEDAAEADVVRAVFVERLTDWQLDPVRQVLWIPSRLIAYLVNEATGEQRQPNKATAYLRTLSIQELRQSNRGKEGRGWLWRGAKAPLDAETIIVTVDPKGLPR